MAQLNFTLLQDYVPQVDFDSMTIIELETTFRILNRLYYDYSKEHMSVGDFSNLLE